MRSYAPSAPHTNQEWFNLWHKFLSLLKINGVCQGGIPSPILFTACLELEKQGIFGSIALSVLSVMYLHLFGVFTKY